MTKRGKSLSRLALHMRSHPLCYWSEPFDTSAQSTCDLFTRHTHATALSCLHTPGALRLFCRIWISVSFMIMISCRSMCVEDEAAIASPPLTDSGAAPFLRSAALCLVVLSVRKPPVSLARRRYERWPLLFLHHRPKKTPLGSPTAGRAHSSQTARRPTPLRPTPNNARRASSRRRIAKLRRLHVQSDLHLPSRWSLRLARPVAVPVRGGLVRMCVQTARPCPRGGFMVCGRA